jgi:predicted nuclease of restriction endonuclease-like (RecB) superfamily
MTSDKKKPKQIPPTDTALFDRISAILDEARANVVRAVNSNTIIAYWLIGREIVQALQAGEDRAEYGKQVIADLSALLMNRYGKGFSEANLKSFRQFYLVFRDRHPEIGYPVGSQSVRGKSYPAGGESEDPSKHHEPCDVLDDLPQAIERTDRLLGFSPQLSWSHYRALMRVEKPEGRDFYESEAIQCGWNKRQLERQISSLFYERLLMSKDKRGMLLEARSEKDDILKPIDVLKDPYILEFLDLPDDPRLHEAQLESAIIKNLQTFLLELGKGFSFVARQKRMRFDDKDFYVDLVFYNYLLKCFILVDLKIGELTHQDIGQMDGYVRMYEEHGKVKGDNPTVGLILCSEKNEAVVRYSVLNENRQLFVSKYMLYLPTEEELKRELERERRLLEERLPKGEG